MKSKFRKSSILAATLIVASSLAAPAFSQQVTRELRVPIDSTSLRTTAGPGMVIPVASAVVPVPQAAAGAAAGAPISGQQLRDALADGPVIDGLFVSTFSYRTGGPIRGAIVVVSGVCISDADAPATFAPAFQLSGPQPICPAGSNPFQTSRV